MHRLVTDLEYGTIVSSGRKSVTLTASDHNFLLKRVIRKPYERKIKEGLLGHSSPALSPAEYESLHAAKYLWTENLASWPTQFPLLKFSVQRFSSLYFLAAIDEKSTDSYFLKTSNWEHVKRALLDLTEQRVQLPSPLVLEFSNPLACYAPFEIPDWQATSAINAQVQEALQNAADRLFTEQSAGFLSPKIASHYLRLLAEVEALSALPSLIPPPINDFENP